jgi:pyruvate/2-oxoacid:ferredoxin oxidoreductase beta subunit
MLKRAEAMKSVVDFFAEVPCVVTVGGCWIEWDRIRGGDGNFGVKTLGSGSSVGLGLALALPNRRIVVLDGDGAVLMNVNGLMTLGRVRPKNLIHVVFDNKVYEASGYVPTGTSHNADLVAIAQGAGIKQALRVDSVDKFKEAVQRGFRSDGPHFIVADTEISYEDYGYARIDETDNKFRFTRWLEKLEGRTIREDAVDVKSSIR